MNVHERAILEAEAQLAEHEDREINGGGECPCERCERSRVLIGVVKKALKERTT